MKVLFTHEIHASRVNDIYYNKNGVINNAALLNYLHYCNEGILISRSITESGFEEGASYQQISSCEIEVIPLKEFSLSSIWYNLKQVLKNVNSANCHLIRLPGLTGTFVGIILLLKGKPYGVELAGDLEEGLHEVYKNPGLVKKTLFKIFKSINSLLIKKATSVAYRSELLKQKYKNKNSESEFVFSGAQISHADVGAPHDVNHYNSNEFILSVLGRLSPEKGISYLIEAVGLLKKVTSKPIRLEIIGDGIQFEELKSLAESLGLNNDIIFHGKVTQKNEIHKILDRSHLYIIPSLTEGMPRALIEAMARGCAAIGANVGGIPEMLEDDNLFNPRDTEAIKAKILSVLLDSEQLVKMSEMNFAKSKDHWEDSIKIVKDKFWKSICK